MVAECALCVIHRRAAFPVVLGSSLPQDARVMTLSSGPDPLLWDGSAEGVCLRV